MKLGYASYNIHVTGDNTNAESLIIDSIDLNNFTPTGIITLMNSVSIGSIANGNNGASIPLNFDAGYTLHLTGTSTLNTEEVAENDYSGLGNITGKADSVVQIDTDMTLSSSILVNDEAPTIQAVNISNNYTLSVDASNRDRHIYAPIYNISGTNSKGSLHFIDAGGHTTTLYGNLGQNGAALAGITLDQQANLEINSSYSAISVYSPIDGAANINGSLTLNANGNNITFFSPIGGTNRITSMSASGANNILFRSSVKFGGAL